VGALTAIAAVFLLLLTRDPGEPLAVAAVVVGSAIAVACGVSLVGVAVEERDAALARPRRRRPQSARAVRRGIEAGTLLAALGLLRAVDGLSLITGGFVVAGFVLAELVLSARPAAHSG
jgi:heme O synthase-like polyprenyltransferase